MISLYFARHRAARQRLCDRSSRVHPSLQGGSKFFCGLLIWAPFQVAIPRYHMANSNPAWSTSFCAGRRRALRWPNQLNPSCVARGKRSPLPLPAPRSPLPKYTAPSSLSSPATGSCQFQGRGSRRRLGTFRSCVRDRGLRLGYGVVIRDRAPGVGFAKHAVVSAQVCSAKTPRLPTLRIFIAPMLGGLAHFSR